MKKYINLKITKKYTERTIFTLLLFFFLSATALAQSSIEGTIKNSSNEPILGVNILLKGTDRGASADFKGYYKIFNVPDGTYTLSATFIGYQSFSKEIILNASNKVLNITLLEDAQALDDVVITGVVNPKSRLESSISITSLQPEKIMQSAPRSTAEIFRTLPGIRSESSGGEGNANIAVRGVPISSGGSKYLQLQEDGLPVLLYGDISFATSDIFLRFDANVARIEAIRGGSASILSSNSPGGIINIISKTGKIEGGSISTFFGLDYQSFRTDFDYGSSIGDKLYFHVGGFYRVGEGVRKTGFIANNGGQLKLNLTKEFENGYVRLYTKFLNDRTAAYMPMPIQVTGTNSDPTWENAPNFNATHGALQTPFLSQNVGLGPDGELRRSKVADGMHPISKSIGADILFNLDDGWKIRNNGRFTINNGRFVSPFPAKVGRASDIAKSFEANSTLSYANGDGIVEDDRLISKIHLFDAELNNFNNFMNDFRVSKSFESVDITIGYFKSTQNISMSWIWNSYLQEVSDDNARLINVSNALGVSLSENGLYAYGVPEWGNCCQRNYDTQYNVSAPYVNISVEASENLSIDGGLRYDKGNVDGSFAGTVQRENYDINNDGTISGPEKSVSDIDNANATVVNYDYDYISYSLGVNYKLVNRQTVFVRYSRGAAAKADRILFAEKLNKSSYLDGNKINAKDFIDQAELGFKKKFDKGYLYATAFFAKTTEEGGFEVTSNSIIENNYKSIGVELEGSYSFGNFDLRGTVTYTKAEITSGKNKGNIPRRQPDFIYSIIPTYNFGADQKNNIGLSLIGQSKAFAQDSNKLIMPGFVMFNAFTNISIAKGFVVNLAANNLFDSLGITESEEGSITEGATNYVRARPLPGRSISLTLSYRF